MEFKFDMILQEIEVCNLKKEANTLCRLLEEGRRVVVFGRRNVGKTSLIRNVVLAQFKRKHKKSLILFADFFGVRSLDEINARLNISFREAFAQSFPTQASGRAFFGLIKSFRPSWSMDPLTNLPTVSITTQEHKALNMEELFGIIRKLSSKYRTVIAIDEFQDIHYVEGAEAVLRTVFQNLSDSVSIIVSGSKKHILGKIFGKHRAPLAGFGVDLEFQPIPYDEYCDYMNDRFKKVRSSIDLETSTYLQDLLQRIPEPINIVCEELMQFRETRYTKIDVGLALKKALSDRQGRLEQYLSRFADADLKVLITLSKMMPVQQILSNRFVVESGLTASGVQKAVRRLEDEAEIYKTHDGYVVADPIMQHYLIYYR